jgi:peptidoglycan hydrolase-like protein with peptidoglycan-binding domain
MKQIKGLPAANNKYFIVKSFGGYSPCIQGNTEHGLQPFPGSVLPNCVGACTGAFNAILNENACNYLGNTNAKNFLALAKKQGLETGWEPRPGCVMVWNSSGAGHVAFVNDKPSSTKVETWESGWSYRNVAAENTTRTKGAGNWGQPSAYNYIGSIYSPAVDPYQTPRNVVIKKGMSGDAVRWLQWALVRSKSYLLNTKSQVDGHFGNNTLTALKKFQKKNGLAADGYCGPATQARICELYTLEGQY